MRTLLVQGTDLRSICASRRHFVTSVLGLGLVAMTGKVSASNWVATRPINVVVPYSAGGGADILARYVASVVGDAMGKQMVVENKAGANGLVGANYAYAARGDGATLLLGAADNISIAPHIYKTAVKFDPVKFKPVAACAQMIFVLCSRKDNKANTYAEAIADLKSRECSYGHWGPGSLPQVGMEVLRMQANIPALLAVPYGGAAPVFAALMAGHIDYAFLPVPMIQGAREQLKLYASGSRERFGPIQDVPTLLSLVFP